MLISILLENPASALSIALCFAVFYCVGSVLFPDKTTKKSKFYDQHRDGPVPTKEERPL
jgi:hypothetical protein